MDAIGPRLSPTSHIAVIFLDFDFVLRVFSRVACREFLAALSSGMAGRYTALLVESRCTLRSLGGNSVKLIPDFQIEEPSNLVKIVTQADSA